MSAQLVLSYILTLLAASGIVCLSLVVYLLFPNLSTFVLPMVLLSPLEWSILLEKI